MSKKYISLQDLYLKESIGKSVPIPPRLKVLGEQDKMEQGYTRVYNIFAQDTSGDEEPEPIGSVDKKDLTKIYNLINKDVSGNVLDKLLEVSNLKELSPQIKNIFNDYEIDYTEVFYNLVSQKANLKLKDTLKEPSQKINLKSLIIPVLETILVGEDESKKRADAEEFYHRIFELQALSKMVSIGSGEALLALFTDASKTKVEKAKKGIKGESKAIKGDISFANGTIEVKVHKAGAGRIASQRQGAFRDTENEVKKILCKRKNNENVTMEDLIPCYEKTNKMNIEVSQEDINRVLDPINQEKDGNKIESLIVAPILTAYARKGFTYIMLISPEGIKSGEASCFQAQNFNVVLNGVLNNQIFMGVDGDGVDVSNIPVRKKGRTSLVCKKTEETPKPSNAAQPIEQPKTREELQAQERPFKNDEPILLPPTK